MIYFDNAATTIPSDTVLSAMTNTAKQYFANPASLSIFGLEAEEQIKESKKAIAKLLQCKPEEIIFTSGGTEADNWAIFGGLCKNKRRGQHIVTTAVEHPAVAACCQQAAEQGASVTTLPVDSKGYVSPQAVEDAIREDTVLVSVIFCQNEIGTVQQIAEIGKRIKQKNPHTLFHVDAVQAFGKFPIDPQKMQIDLLSASAHKIHGPRGIGFLYQAVSLPPMLFGGGQQAGKRSGTENTPGIAGFAAACKEAFVHWQDWQKQCLQVKQVLWNTLKQGVPDCIIYGEDEFEKASPFLLNIGFPGLKSEVLLHALEEKGVIVSAGSACGSRKKTLSPTLAAIGAPATAASLRFSFCHNNTPEEGVKAAQVAAEAVAFLKKYSG